MRTSLLILPISFAVLSGCVVTTYPGPNDPKWTNVQPVAGANHVIRSQSNQSLCLDVKGDKAASNQEVEVFSCNFNANQRWNFVGAPNGASNLQGVGGLCLDVQGGSTADGARVNEFPCGNDKPNQTFRYHQNGHIREAQSNKCLTVNPISSGSALFLQTCDPLNQGQYWVIQ